MKKFILLYIFILFFINNSFSNSKVIILNYIDTNYYTYKLSNSINIYSKSYLKKFILEYYNLGYRNFICISNSFVKEINNLKNILNNCKFLIIDSNTIKSNIYSIKFNENKLTKYFACICATQFKNILFIEENNNNIKILKNEFILTLKKYNKNYNFFNFKIDDNFKQKEILNFIKNNNIDIVFYPYGKNSLKIKNFFSKNKIINLTLNNNVFNDFTLLTFKKNIKKAINYYNTILSSDFLKQNIIYIDIKNIYFNRNLNNLFSINQLNDMNKLYYEIY